MIADFSKFRDVQIVLLRGEDKLKRSKHSRNRGRLRNRSREKYNKKQCLLNNHVLAAELHPEAATETLAIV